MNFAYYTCFVEIMFGCVNSLPLACWTSHVAFLVGFRFFRCKVSAGGILQVLVSGSRFLQIISTAFRIFFVAPLRYCLRKLRRCHKQNVVFPNFP